MGEASLPPADRWRRAALANFVLVSSWLSTPGLLAASAGALIYGVGAPYGLALPLAFGGLVKANTGPARFAICGLLGAIGTRLGTPSALLASGATAMVAALLSLGVPSWPGLVDVVSDVFCIHSYYKRCELRGALESMQDARSVYAFHPHGILAVGFSLNGAWNPQFLRHCGPVRFLIDFTLRHKAAFFRVLLGLYEHPSRGFSDAERPTLVELMSKGHNLAIIPGGFMEATLFRHGEDRVAIKTKKTLIRLCLQHGYRIHPIYTFGESDTFYAFQGLRRLRLWLAKHNVPTVIFFGATWCPFLPRHQAELVTYVGEPLELPHIPEPTQQEVDEWHGRYVDALSTLFDSKKAEAGRPNAKLELF